MNIYDLIEKRHSIRHYTDKEVEYDKLKRIM